MSNPITDIDPSKWLDLHGNALYAYATSFLRNRELAEEVMQRRSALLKSRRGASCNLDFWHWVSGFWPDSLLRLPKSAQSMVELQSRCGLIGCDFAVQVYGSATHKDLCRPTF